MPKPRRLAPLLVVFGGLPGTGKSVLAAHVAGLLQAPLFAKDVIEAALTRSGITRKMGSGFAAYEQLTALAETQLRLDLSVVLDSVAAYQRIRDEWRLIAKRTGAVFCAIECVATDQRVHRSRLEARSRRIPGWPELSWSDVEEVRSRYEPWRDDSRLIVDAINSLETNLAAVEDFIRRTRAGRGRTQDTPVR